MIDKTLKQIARLTRREMVDFHKKHQLGFSDLCCYCAIASYLLVKVAKKFGYELELIIGNAFVEDARFLSSTNHCWTKFNGKIIDLTATQFDVKQLVYVVSETNKNYVAVASGTRAMQNIEKTWEDQSPLVHMPELKKRANKIAKLIQEAA